MAKKSNDSKPVESRHTTHTGRHGSSDRMVFHSDLETFAGHLSMLPRELRANLKLPPWLQFLFPNRRKDQANLTATDRSRFLCAFQTLNANGALGQFVEVHGQFIHHMHHTLRFLPWHRVFLVRLELAIQAIHPDVTIPYWDWTNPGEQDFPPWLAAVLPTVVTPSKTITVTRAPGTTATSQPLPRTHPTRSAKPASTRLPLIWRRFTTACTYGWRIHGVHPDSPGRPGVFGCTMPTLTAFGPSGRPAPQAQERIRRSPAPTPSWILIQRQSRTPGVSRTWAMSTNRASPLVSIGGNYARVSDSD